MGNALLRACACALLLLVQAALAPARYLFVWAGDAAGEAIIAVDTAFRNPGYAGPGFSMSNLELPHGFRGAGLPHGAVSSR